jgi:hypothetical protein
VQQVSAPRVDRYAIAWDEVVYIAQGIAWRPRARCLRVDGVLRVDGALILRDENA